MPNLDPITAVIAADPYPYYATLVADQPFSYDEDLGMWVAADAATVSAVLAEPALRVRPVAAPVPAQIAGTSAGDIFERLVRMTDGEAQKRFKRAVVTALGTVDVDRVAVVAAERAAYAIERQAPMRELMFGVPIQVLGVLSDLDDPRADNTSALIADFVQCIPSTATPEQSARAATAATAVLDLLSPALDVQGDGLLAQLARAAGPDVEPATVLANGVGLLAQTFDATAGLIGNTLVALARGTAHARPGSMVTLVAEVARHDAPIQNTRRFAAEPVTVADRDLATGDAVLVVLAAANRDPAANEAPDEFRTDRHDPAVFTFGAGAHGCPGRLLAITIAATVVDAVLSAGLIPTNVQPFTYLPLANARIPLL